MYYYEYFRDSYSQKILWFIGCAPTKNHIHKGIEVLGAMQDDTEITYNDQKIILKKGDCVFIPPLAKHSILSNNEIMLLLIPIYYLDFYTKHTNNLFLTNPVINKDSNPRLYQKFWDSLIGFKEINLNNELKVYTQIYTCLSLASDMLRFDTTPTSLCKQKDSLDIISQITEYVNENYKETITIENLSKRFGYNKCYLSDILHKELQLNFRDYINSIRLDNFLNYYNSKLTLEEQIDEFGFSNRQTFYRAFKKKYGISPTKYLL